jgi:hypothetical protein
MIGHKTYFDPPRTSPIRCTEWAAPKKGHRVFSAPVAAKAAAVKAAAA